MGPASELFRQKVGYEQLCTRWNREEAEVATGECVVSVDEKLWF